MNAITNLTFAQSFRFLVSGAICTLLSYGAYIALCVVFKYQLAYFISYLIGIIFSYINHASFVFKTNMSLMSFIRFPLVYIVQYVCGAVLLQLLVMAGASITFAPLFVIALTLPLTFILSRFVFTGLQK